MKVRNTCDNRTEIGAQVLQLCEGGHNSISES